MTDEEKQKLKDYQKQYRENMADEQKQRHKGAKNKRDRDRYNKMTDEEKQKRRDYQKEYKRNMTDEQKQKERDRKKNIEKT